MEQVDVKWALDSCRYCGVDWVLAHPLRAGPLPAFHSDVKGEEVVRLEDGRRHVPLRRGSHHEAGIAVGRLKSIEGTRGPIAAWALIGFGLAYFVWGVRSAIRNKPHTHAHDHEDDGDHAHEHVHEGEHTHVHDKKTVSITPWVLFTIFVLGPCEPLIPILMYPAAEGSVWGLLLVTAVFGVVTIATMMSVVMVMSLGISMVPLGRLERYSHAMAGAAILMSGAAIQFLGL